MKGLILEVEELRLEATKVDADGKDIARFERRRAALLKRARRIKVDMDGSLKRFSTRIGKETAIAGAAVPLKVMQRRREFCDGALLCQSGKVNAEGLSSGTVGRNVSASQHWGFICVFCNLEVGNYSAVRLSSHGEALESQNQLAACHIVACASLSNRRAFYKCLACYQDYKDVDFPSALDLEKHMLEHPGYSFVRNERGVAEAMKKRINDLVLDPTIVASKMAEEDDDGLAEITSDGGQFSSDHSGRVLPEKPQQLAEGRMHVQQVVTNIHTRSGQPDWGETPSDEEKESPTVSPVEPPADIFRRDNLFELHVSTHDSRDTPDLQAPLELPAMPISSTSGFQTRHELREEMTERARFRGRPALQPVEVPAHVPERPRSAEGQSRSAPPPTLISFGAVPPVPTTEPPPLPYGAPSDASQESYSGLHRGARILDRSRRVLRKPL